VSPEQHHDLRRGAHRVQDLRALRGRHQGPGLHSGQRRGQQHLRGHPRGPLHRLHLPLRQVQRGDRAGKTAQEPPAVLPAVWGQEPVKAEDAVLSRTWQEDFREGQGHQGQSEAAEQ